MKLLTALKRHLFMIFGNAMPAYDSFNRMRASLYRKAGMSIGRDVTIVGPLTVELSVNEETIRGISIGDRTYLNADTRLACRNSRISIGVDVLIGPRVSFETATHDIELGRGLDHHEIRVENNVWIGAGATILPGVTAPLNRAFISLAVFFYNNQQNVDIIKLMLNYSMTARIHLVRPGGGSPSTTAF